MKRKVVSITLVIAVLTLVFAIASFANVPPPPVNQTIGIDDTTFNNLAEADCRVCHGTTVNVNRHHALIGTNWTCPSAAPNDTCPTISTYECMVCHTLVFNGTAWVLAPFRDCMECHKQTGTDGYTVHHATTQAQAQNCTACHGYIENPTAVNPHYIPTYPASTVTPRTGLGTTSGPLGPGQGGCAYCHGPALNPDGTSPAPLTDTASGVLVYANADTHHSTGLGGDDTKCAWCHNVTPGAIKIRKCEECHSVYTLHNIQTDSNGNSLITPGTESPYYGHIGANADCNGCHLNTSADVAPYSGPVMPGISDLSKATVIKGVNTTIIVTGSALTNTVQGYVLNSNLVLTASDGSVTTLTPSAISESSMTVTIPGTLAVGTYKVRAVKADNQSNCANISVIPPVTISNTSCSGGTVTITGSGFAEYVDAANIDLGVTLKDRRGKIIDCAINSWDDSQIRANCGNNSGNLVVSSVFGKAASSVTCSSNNSGGKKK